MADHEAAVAELVAAIRAVPTDRWATPPAPDKWSAAEAAWHLILAYRHLLREQVDGTPVRVLPAPWKAWLLRKLLLPRLLAGRPLPRGVRAPREVRPSGERRSQEETLAALTEAKAAWCGAMTRNSTNGGARATHPFFGPLPLVTMVRFTSLHLRHHCRQIQRAGAGLPLHEA